MADQEEEVPAVPTKSTVTGNSAVNELSELTEQSQNNTTKVATTESIQMELEFDDIESEIINKDTYEEVFAEQEDGYVLKHTTTEIRQSKSTDQFNPHNETKQEDNDCWPPEPTEAGNEDTEMDQNQQNQEDENLIVLGPDHPLMQKYQKALKEHLQRQIEKTDAETRSKVKCTIQVYFLNVQKQKFECY